MLDSAISQAAVFDIELRGNAVLNKLHEQLYELNSWAISNKEESFMKQLKEFEIVLNEAYHQCNNYSNELIDDYHARQYFRARVPIPVYHPILPHLKRCEPEEPTPTLQTQQMKPTQRERTFRNS